MSWMAGAAATRVGFREPANAEAMVPSAEASWLRSSIAPFPMAIWVPTSSVVVVPTPKPLPARLSERGTAVEDIPAGRTPTIAIASLILCVTSPELLLPCGSTRDPEYFHWAMGRSQKIIRQLSPTLTGMVS